MSPKLVEVISNDILDRFDLDREAVFFLKADFAKEYLHYRFPQDPDIIAGLLKHPAFWEWWAQLWAERDRKLLRQCDKRPYGIRWTYPIGKTVNLANGDSYTPTETNQIIHQNVWPFYKATHHWRRVQLFPNYQLINECLSDAKKQNLVKQ